MRNAVRALRTSGARSTSPHNDHKPVARSYDAFLSYNHADLALAAALQRGLHRFARPVWALRSLRVYRDRTDLSAGDLWAPIAGALDHSRYLVVVLSPGAAASRHVANEIDHWLAHGRAAELLLVVAVGEIVWDESQRRFDPARSTALPARLCEPDLFHEPLYVDLRSCVGERNLTLENADFRQGVVSLAATIHGKEKSELESEDRTEHRRLVRLRRAAIVSLGVLLVAASAAALLAKSQRDEARSQRGIAETRALAARANAADSPWEALPLAIEAVRHATPPLRAASDAHARAIQRLERSPLLPESPPLLEHHQTVSAIAFAPDGKRMATAGGTPIGKADGSVRVWTVGAGGAKLERRLTELNDGLTGSVAWSPDGSRLAAASNEGIIDVYATDSWSVVATWREHDAGPPGTLVESPLVAWSGGRIVVGDKDGDVRVHDAANGRVVWEHPTDHGAIYGLSVMGTKVAAGGLGAVELLDTNGGQTWPSLVLPALDGRLVQAVAWSPDGRTLLAGTDQKILRWSRPGSGTAAEPVVLPEGAVTQLAWTADGSRYASAATDGSVRLWRANGTQILDPVVAHRPAVFALAWSPDGKRLATGGDGDAAVRTWRFVGADQHPFAQLGGATQVSVSPNGRFVVGFNSFSAVFWEVSKGGEGKSLGIATRVAWSTGDGARLAVVGPQISVFDLQSGSLLSQTTVDLKKPMPTAAGLSPDGRRLAVGDTKGRVTVYDATTLSIVATTPTTHGAITQLAWRPDGVRLASSSATTLVMWSISGATLHTEATLVGNASKAMAWRSNQVLQGVGADYAVSTWRLPNRLPHRAHKRLVPDNALAVAFAGPLVISGDGNGNIRFVNVPSEESIGDATNPSDGWISSLSVSVDGLILATASNSGVFRVWSATSASEACHVAITALGKKGLADLVGTQRPACSDPAKVHDLPLALEPIGGT